MIKSCFIYIIVVSLIAGCGKPTEQTTEEDQDSLDNSQLKRPATIRFKDFNEPKLALEAYFKDPIPAQNSQCIFYESHKILDSEGMPQDIKPDTIQWNMQALYDLFIIFK